MRFAIGVVCKAIPVVGLAPKPISGSRNAIEPLSFTHLAESGEAMSISLGNVIIDAR